MDTNTYLAACGLPKELGDLWACEVAFDAYGQPIFHIEPLMDVLQTNEVHAANGWHAGFVMFALCKTIEEANATCDRMRKKQHALMKLRHAKETQR